VREDPIFIVTATKAVIVPEVERLHWRNGKAKNARRTLERVRKVMRVFQIERHHRTTTVPSSRKLRHGPRVATSVTEGTANFLVNRRMVTTWRQLPAAGAMCSLQRRVRTRLWQSIRANTEYGPAITAGRLTPDNLDTLGEH
jgi:hypothetical protein